MLLVTDIRWFLGSTGSAIRCKGAEFKSLQLLHL